jgi:hypothetical protein
MMGSKLCRDYRINWPVLNGVASAANSSRRHWHLKKEHPQADPGSNGTSDSLDGRGAAGTFMETSQGLWLLGWDGEA